MDAEQLEKDISLLRYTNSPIWQWFLDNFKDEEKTGDKMPGKTFTEHVNNEGNVRKKRTPTKKQ